MSGAVGETRVIAAAAGLGDPGGLDDGRRCGVSGHRLGVASHVADHDRDAARAGGRRRADGDAAADGKPPAEDAAVVAVGAGHRIWEHDVDTGRHQRRHGPGWRRGGGGAGQHSPFFVAIIARFVLAERITRLRAAGLVIGFAGVLLVVFADPGNIAHGPRLAIGLGLALLGALGWAGGGLGMRVLTEREPDLDIPGSTAAQFLAGGIPLIPLVLLDGGSTDWGRPVLLAQLAYLILGGQVLVYVGFNAALSRWPSTRVYAWTFLVPAVAVLVEAIRGSLPGVGAMAGIVLVILGVAIVNLPRAEGAAVGDAVAPEDETPVQPAPGVP